MNGTATSSSTGTGTIQGKGLIVGASAGSSTASGWFSQIGSLTGTAAGSSLAAQVSRTVIDAFSTITLIAEYDSAI